mmetsp:Transcript_10521/g.14616  ORF Transcript_10521/g.14616 Transcript_10521/m.14616 type:complete len:102 (-) Transcript_10521:350-655(-)
MATRPRYRHAEEMEEQNNALLGQLGNKLHMMKANAKDLGIEIRDQNDRLKDMETPMGDLGGMFKRTMSAMGQLSKGGGSCHMCYLILFVFVFFLLVKYLLM